MTDYNTQNLINAIDRGDIDVVKEYLDDGMSPDACDDERNSLLHHVALHNKGDIIELLVKRGADVNTRGDYEETPLNTAVRSRNLEAVKTLLKCGANPSLQDKSKDVALTYSIVNGSYNIAEELIRAGAELNARNDEGNTPLLYAIARGEVEITKLLLKSGADTAIPNKQGELPLTVASQRADNFDYPYKEVTEVLIQHEIKNKTKLIAKNDHNSKNYTERI